MYLYRLTIVRTSRCRITLSSSPNDSLTFILLFAPTTVSDQFNYLTTKQRLFEQKERPLQIELKWSNVIESQKVTAKYEQVYNTSLQVSE